jgi:hypothetical protein
MKNNVIFFFPFAKKQATPCVHLLFQKNLLGNFLYYIDINISATTFGIDCQINDLSYSVLYFEKKFFFYGFPDTLFFICLECYSLVIHFLFLFDFSNHQFNALRIVRHYMSHLFLSREK